MSIIETRGDRFGQVACREALRAATAAPHARLHQHAGFATVENGTIALPAYRALLARLYGFYEPFERALDTDPIRTRWLAADLAWLGIEAPALARIQTCAEIPPYPCRTSRLGALYVVEGSALGGRQLSRGLERLLGQGSADGRRFLVGRDADTGAAWRDFVERLIAADAEMSGRTTLIAAATATFAVFETWLADWSETE
jgi:heme oxygenase